MILDLKYPPRLARLYSADVRKLEAIHAGQLAPGTKTWDEAVEALYGRMVKAGPVKGVRLLKRAADYLNGVGEDERAHLVLGCGGKHATSAFAFIAVLGYIAHRTAKHANGGLHMCFSGLLAAGHLHRLTKVWPDGHSIEQRFYDVRTCLPVDELGPARQPQLEQGKIAAAAVVDWFEEADLDEAGLAERIPALARREDSYPSRAVSNAPVSNGPLVT